MPLRHSQKLSEEVKGLITDIFHRAIEKAEDFKRKEEAARLAAEEAEAAARELMEYQSEYDRLLVMKSSKKPGSKKQREVGTKQLFTNLNDFLRVDRPPEQQHEATELIKIILENLGDTLGIRGGGIIMSNRNSRLRSRNKRKTRQIKRKTRKTRKIKRKIKRKTRKTRTKSKRKIKRRSQRVRKIR